MGPLVDKVEAPPAIAPAVARLALPHSGQVSSNALQMGDVCGLLESWKRCVLTMLVPCPAVARFAALSSTRKTENGKPGAPGLAGAASSFRAIGSPASRSGIQGLSEEVHIRIPRTQVVDGRMLQ